MKKYFIAIVILSVCQIARAIDVNSLNPNLYLQKIKELERTVKAQQQKIDQFTAALANAKKEIEQLQIETTELKEKNSKLQEQIGGSASTVPFTGEETPLTTVKAYPEKYIGKTFVVIGRVGVSDFYSYKYEGAKGTHVSLRFAELRQDMSRTGVEMDLYVKREISENLVEKITKAVDSGHNSELIRVKASILGNRYNPNCMNIQAELIDWQFLSSDKKSWQDWAISEGTAKPYVETPYNLPKGEIIYRGRMRRSQEWFDKMYERFYDKIAYIDGKYYDVQEEMLNRKRNRSFVPYPPLTKEQFAEAIKSGFMLVNYIKIGEKVNKRPVP